MEEKSFAAQLDCRYLLHTPAELTRNPLLMIALHGYSSNPEAMLTLTLRMVGDARIPHSCRS